MARTDVLVVSIGATGGWRAAASELADSVRRAGAEVVLAEAAPVRRVRTFALTDLVQARAARATAREAIAAHDPRTVIYMSITAALLWPAPGAISLDSVAAENRPGRHGIWQRPVERRRLREAPLMLAWSPRSLDPIAPPHAPVVLAPPPIELGSRTGAPRDIDAITYAGDPVKRRLSLVLHAWARARRPGETLLVTGTDTIGPADGVAVSGIVAPDEFRALLARARVFVAAPQREDFGIAALEALAQGCALVTTPSPGPYPARELASRLDARLVSDDLATAIRTALDDPVADYAGRAAGLLQPFTRAAVDHAIAHEVLPRLLE